MEKLKPLDFDEAMELLREEITGDSMPWYWSLPVSFQVVQNTTMYMDNIDKMAEYLTTKYYKEIVKNG